MTEFYHNLSMQAFNIPSNSVQVTFGSSTNLVKNINILIEDEIFKLKKIKIADNKIIYNEINDYNYKLIKTPMEEIKKVLSNLYWTIKKLIL